jgi:hypothetical protein
MSEGTGPSGSPSPRPRLWSYAGLVLLLAPVYVFIFTEKLWIRTLAIILFIGGMLVLLSLLVSLRRAGAGSTHHPWNRWLWSFPIAMVAFTALFFVGLIFDLSMVTMVASVILVVLPIAFPIAARMVAGPREHP